MCAAEKEGKSISHKTEMLFLFLYAESINLGILFTFFPWCIIILEVQNSFERNCFQPLFLPETGGISSVTETAFQWNFIDNFCFDHILSYPLCFMTILPVNIMIGARRVG